MYFNLHEIFCIDEDKRKRGVGFIKIPLNL
jgi:hypothetical protein